MALTVFAEKMGFFHKGCAGIGVAPVDVCLSPPPGPVPIPYTNVLFSKDLIKGSKTVFIDGEPTFLEDVSETSTSIGDEGGTLGGSVVTGVILGKGYFLVWSMTVQIEGLGVCRHGDMMGQNSASHPFSSADAGSVCRPGDVVAQQPGPVAGMRAAEGEVLEGTGPGDSQPLVAKPCCFEKVTLKCDHTGSGDKKRDFGPMEFTFNGGNIEDNFPDPKDGGAKPPIGLIAGHSERDADTLQIELSGGPGYTCGKNHPIIQIVDLETLEDVVCEKGVVGLGAKLTSREAEMPSFNYMDPTAILNYFWFPSKTTGFYRVMAISCGVEADKSPGFARLSRTIEVHSSDVYKFGLEIPDMFNRSYARARTRPPGANWQDETGDDVQQGWDEGMRDGSDWFGDANAAGERPVNLPAKEVAGSVSFTRNGDNISSATDKLGDIIKHVKEIIDKCQSVFNFISDFQPQLGWKFDFKISFLSGSLSFEWATKEANSQAVYNWWKLSAALTLASLSIEASFGFSVRALGCKLEVVGFLKGEGKIELSDDIEATPDDWEWKPPKLSAEFGFEGGVRAAVGADWVASGEGKVGIAFPFEAEPKVDKKEGFKIDWKWEYSDCKAHVVGRVFLFGSIDREYTIIEGGEIFSGTFPKGSNSHAVATPSGSIPP